jgi:hypothetical protein
LFVWLQLQNSPHEFRGGCRSLALARAVFAAAVAEKPGGRFMIRNRTRNLM